MKKRLFIALSLLLAIQVNAATTVSRNGESLQYPDNARLSAILENYKDDASVYWPAAKLFMRDRSSMQGKLTEIRHKIKSLKSNYPKLEGSLSRLNRDLSKWQLMKRLPVLIDLELSRVDESKNPLLGTNNYFIELPNRAQKITFFGAIKEQSVEFQNKKLLEQYLNEVSVGKYADLSNVFLVYPNGLIEKVGIAYWNQHKLELAPGTMVMIPYHHSMFSKDIETVNRLVVELAKHRVMQ